MNFSQETIEEAIDKLSELCGGEGINLSTESTKTHLIYWCEQIEGDKIRADHEARYVQDVRPEELIAA